MYCTVFIVRRVISGGCFRCSIQKDFQATLETCTVRRYSWRWQSARQPYVSWKIEIGQAGTEAKLEEVWGAKVKMCTVLRYLYRTFWFFRDRTEQKVCVPEYTFSLLPLNLALGPIWLLYQLDRFRFFSWNTLFAPTDWRLGFWGLYS